MTRFFVVYLVTHRGTSRRLLIQRSTINLRWLPKLKNGYEMTFLLQQIIHNGFIVIKCSEPNVKTAEILRNKLRQETFVKKKVQFVVDMYV